MSSTFCGLFPAGVIVAELREPGRVELLPAAEAAAVRHAAPKRVAEFAAGRLCARRVLAEFGIADFALRSADDRQPLWPQGLIGSITHTTGLCMAAVALRREVTALGVDSEVVGAPTTDIWPAICRTEELEWLRTLPAPERAAAVTLIFSAKEAFYKCQYPLVGEWLDFHDLCLEPVAWGANAASFTIRTMRRIGFAGYAPSALCCRYLFHENFVSAAVSLRNQ